MTQARSDAAAPGRRPVFVVDDDPAVLQSLAFSLGTEGYDVSIYRNAKALLGVDALPARGCLIIDYILPDMDGLELARRLRARGIGLPVILITTNPGRTLLRRASAAGIRVVEKPLLSDTLSEAVSASFDSSHL